MLVDSASQGAQALEFDTFQFAGGREYMFGSQCLYATHSWNIWNAGAGKWVSVPITCKTLSPNVWHHIVWHVHRTPDTKMHYDSLTLDAITHVLNITEPSAPSPSGWTHNLGVQWQLDTASAPLSFNEWIDSVKLTIQ